MQRSIYIFIASVALSFSSTQLFASEYGYESYDSDYSTNNQAYYYESDQTYDDRSYHRSPSRYRQSYYDDDGYYYSNRPRQQQRYYRQDQDDYRSSRRGYANRDYSSRLPSRIASSGKVIVVDPNVHAWGAYLDGSLIKSGIATAGANFCRDVGRPCRTTPGSFRIFSLGSASCKSSRYPLPRGGAPMPYCMYFNKNQALHGSNEVADANLSHGCVRLRVSDAEWLRFNFANVGTRVIVKPY